MERLSTFDENVKAPIAKALSEGRLDVEGIKEEILMFACPECGHITLDHSWLPDENDINRCLKECECSGDFSKWMIADGDNPAIIASTNQRIEAVWATL